MDRIENFAKAGVTQGYDDSATEIDIEVADSAKLPSQAPFNLVWWNASDYPDPADDPTVEIVRCTGRDGETLTITRGQEGTAAIDHNTSGKTYKVVQSLTAKSVNEEIISALRTGDNWVITSDGTLAVLVGGITALQLAPGVGQHVLGDVDSNNSGVAFIADDNLGHLLLRGPLASDQIASASGPVGTVVGKVALRDDGGTIIGYLPIYNSIT